MKKETILTALNFKVVDVKTNFWHLNLANGDHMSICLTDGSQGGAFGNKGWERNEPLLDSIRRLLMQYQVISTKEEIVCAKTTILFALGFKPIKGTEHDAWTFTFPGGGLINVRISDKHFSIRLMGTDAMPNGEPIAIETVKRVTSIYQVLSESNSMDSFDFGFYGTTLHPDCVQLFELAGGKLVGGMSLKEMETTFGLKYEEAANKPKDKHLRDAKGRFIKKLQENPKIDEKRFIAYVDKGTANAYAGIPKDILGSFKEGFDVLEKNDIGCCNQNLGEHHE